MRHTGKQVEETMKKTFTFTRIIAVTLIALVVGVLWLGAIVSGFAFDLALALKLF